MDYIPIIRELTKQLSGVSMLNDLIIKKILGNPHDSEERLKSFINAIRKQSGDTLIEQVEILDPAIHPDVQEDKVTFLDIKAKDSQGDWYNIEVQLCPQNYFISRIIYYGTQLHSSQLSKGNDYSLIRPTICIVITDFTLFNQYPRAFHSFALLSTNEPQMLLSNDLQFYFMEMSKMSEKQLQTLNSDLSNWIQFLNFTQTSEDKMNSIMTNSPAFANTAAEVTHFVSGNRALIEAQEKARRDRVAQIEYARDQGRAEGRAEELLNVIQTIVLHRFAVSLSDQVKVKLAQLDIRSLEEIMHSALVAASIEQLEQTITDRASK